MTEADALALLNNASVKEFKNVNIVGLMGMATFTEDEAQLVSEFSQLKNFFDTHKTAFNFKTLSMGMSGDYKIAIARGSTMIRVGSSIFGERN
tara:strand:+ start:804 stop:1082 length:279 start_codon:yes stop_codon:yes gene_type:complete